MCVPESPLFPSSPSSDELDKLITDRPESCRRKPLDPQLAPPQPVLSLQCLTVHHQLQLQLHAQPRITPTSPAPAQTPPLHPVPELVKQPPPPPPQPAEIFSVHSDVHSEVDALDPSIMDFALQGWRQVLLNFSMK